MLVKSFQLKFTRQELGAVIKSFLGDEDTDQDKDEMISVGDFLRYFFQLGAEERERDRKQRRKKQVESLKFNQQS